MTNLTVNATIQARRGSEGTVLDSLVQLLAPTRAEDGCIAYDLHQDTEDPHLFIFHETWESEEHLDRHLASEHIAANRERISDHIVSLDVRKLRRVQGPSH